MNEMKPLNIIGISLGTDRTILTRFNEAGAPEIVCNSEGEPWTYSAVAFEDKQVFVGREAKKLVGAGCDHSISGFKRWMGTDKTWPIDGRAVTPIELTAILLRKIVGDYAEQHGEPDEVTITWPGNFRQDQRIATKEAARRSGLKNARFVEDAASVALYHVSQKMPSGTYVICDFGAGVFNATIFASEDKRLSIAYQDGVLQLGGIDLDNVLLAIIAEKFRSHTDGKFDRTDCNLDQLDLESIRHTISYKSIVQIRLVSATHGPVSFPVSLAEFEARIDDLIVQAEMACENALRCGKSDPAEHIRKSDINGIILTGGVFRTPSVSRRIRNLYGSNVIFSDPHFTAAYGAAIHAAINSAKHRLNVAQVEAVDGLGLNPIAPHFLGTAVYGDVGLINDTVIAKGTKLPCTVKRSYRAVRQESASISYSITESSIEETDMSFVTTIQAGTHIFKDAQGRKAPLELTYSYDLEGCASLQIREIGTDDGFLGVTANLYPPAPPPLADEHRP
jgi:molecular chaperone DnaK (HSP70)